jgi:hypothetical protein
VVLSGDPQVGKRGCITGSVEMNRHGWKGGVGDPGVFRPFLPALIRINDLTEEKLDALSFLICDKEWSKMG